MDNIESHQVSGTSTKAAVHFHLSHPQQPPGLPTLQFHLNGLLEAQNHLYPLIPLEFPSKWNMCSIASTSSTSSLPFVVICDVKQIETISALQHLYMIKVLMHARAQQSYSKT